MRAGAVPGIEVFGAITLNRSVGNENRPYVPLAKDGRLLPEVIEVLKVIAKEKLALATGHSSPAEGLMLVREAGKLGVTRMVVTHPQFNVVNMQISEMQEAARLGAYLEFCANQVLSTVAPANRIEFAEYVKAIRALGAEHAKQESRMAKSTS